MRWIRLIIRLAVAGLWVAAVGGCGGGSSSPTLTITITPTSASVDQGQTSVFSAVVAGDIKNAGVKWSVSGTNCTGSACGTLLNSSTISVTYKAPKGLTTTLGATLTATAVSSSKSTATASVTVELPPGITTTSLLNGSNGAQYQQTITATGGVNPLTFSLVSGSLPAGLFLNASGTIQGIPTGSGTSNTFTVLVKDSGNPPVTATQTYTIAITPPAPLSIATLALPNGQLGTAYNAALEASGGVPPITWSNVSGSGNLPSGLTLDSSTGQISGTPTVVGPSFFSVQARDSAIPPQQATQALSITIGTAPPLAIVPAFLPDGVTATAYSAPLQATGGIPPYTWTVTSGQLPPGLNLDSSTGLISGDPVRAVTSKFTVQVEDSKATPEKAFSQFSITVTANSKGDDALLNGGYVFLFHGFNSAGSVFIAGQFSADGNGVMNGVEDLNFSGQKAFLNQAFNGTYSLGTNGLGTLSIPITEPGGATATSNFVMTMDAQGGARFIVDTDSTPGLRGFGILKKQSSGSFTAANLAGNYAFGFSGLDSNGKRAVIAGAFHADGTNALSEGDLETNDAGSLGHFSIGVSGSFSNLSANGRGNASLFLGGTTTLNFNFYLVSPSDAFFISTDNFSQTNPPLFVTSGEALQQQPGTTSGNFDGNSLFGASVASGTGLATAKASVFAGLLSANGAGKIESFIEDQNAGGTISSTANSPVQGSYSVAANGRVVFSGLGNRVGFAYLVGQNQGFLIGTDTAATSGLLESQSGGPIFNNVSIEDSYALNAGFPAENKVNNLVGGQSADGAGNISGRVDIAIASTDSTNFSQALTATYAVSANGRGTLQVSSPSVLPKSFVFYVVSPSKVRLVSSVSSDTDPAIFFFDP